MQLNLISYENSGFVIHSTNDNQDTNEIGSIGFVIRNLGDGQPNRKFLKTHFVFLGI